MIAGIKKIRHFLVDHLCKVLMISFRAEPKVLILTVFASVVLSFVQISGVGIFLPIISLLQQKDMTHVQIPIVGKIFKDLSFEPSTAINFILFVLFLIIISRAFLDAWILILRQKLKKSVEQSWQFSVINHWLKLQPLEHKMEDRSYVMHLCGNEIINIGRSAVATINFLAAVIQIGVTLTFLFLLSWKMICFILPFIMIIMIPLPFIFKRIYQAAENDASAFMSYTRRAFDVIKRIALIDIFSVSGSELKSLEDDLKRFGDAAMSLQKARVVGPVVIECIGAGLICIVILFFFHSSSGPKALQNLILFVGSLVIILPQMVTINNAIGDIARVDAAVKRVERILKRPLLVRKAFQREELPKAFDFKIQGVDFSYPGKADNVVKVLDNVSLTIPQGKLTMLFGASGSGKTTLLNVLDRLYTVQSGTMTVGGIAIEEYSPSVWRKLVLLMPQENVVLNASISDNIAYGEDHVTEEVIRDSAQIAEAMEFIQKTNKGFASPVGDDGSLLSGGQKQRLALARVLAKKPRILLLDEPTSSLDRFTENHVMNNLRELRNQGTTILMSTHKIELALFADHLFWFENGKIYEGTFDDFRKDLARLEYKVK